jgi:beta-carotene 3-hydroxylase
MNTLYNAIYVVLGFVLMEGFVYVFHKYVMHGFLWRIHATHHKRGKGMFELNDVFLIFFASLGIAQIIYGLPEYSSAFWFGCGVSVYGLTNFFFHDIVIHRRIRWTRTIRNRYIQGIIHAHQAHHKHTTNDTGEEYGLLLFHPRHLRLSEESTKE